tara:strand:+ start:6259 stop:6639 length:381 start_codon:yes stop_codon:yes gene_type:complete
MKLYLSVDTLEDEQWNSLGVSIEAIKHDVERAAQIYAQKLQAELLHRYYIENPGEWQLSQPDEIVKIFAKKETQDSPYGSALIDACEKVDSILNSCWFYLASHHKQERLYKDEARDMADGTTKEKA